MKGQVLDMLFTIEQSTKKDELFDYMLFDAGRKELRRIAVKSMLAAEDDSEHKASGLIYYNGRMLYTLEAETKIDGSTVKGYCSIRSKLTGNTVFYTMTIAE